MWIHGTNVRGQVRSQVPPVPGPGYKPGSVASHLITIWPNLNNHLVQEKSEIWLEIVCTRCTRSRNNHLWGKIKFSIKGVWFLVSFQSNCKSAQFYVKDSIRQIDNISFSGKCPRFFLQTLWYWRYGEPGTRSRTMSCSPSRGSRTTRGTLSVRRQWSTRWPQRPGPGRLWGDTALDLVRGLPSNWTPYIQGDNCKNVGILSS